MKAGDKIDHNNFNENTCREWHDMQEFVNAIRPLAKVWSWGARAWTKMNAYCLRFTVSGHHHKGHVYIVVNGRDEFVIYLTSNRGKIKLVIEGIYLDNIIEVIDDKVERIAAYVD